MAEFEEKELTGDLAIDDESAGEVTGGREASRETASVAEFMKPARMTSRWTKHWKARWTHGRR